MSDEPVFRAQFAGFSYLKGAGEYKIELRVPRHEWHNVYAIIGDPPDAGQSKWIGCALLTEEQDAPAPTPSEG